jgi:hypothetical protein
MKPDPIFAEINEARRLTKIWMRHVSKGGPRGERAAQAEMQQAKRVARTRPTTLAGVGALLTYLKDDMQAGHTYWHDVAVATAIVALDDWARMALATIAGTSRGAGQGGGAIMSNTLTKNAPTPGVRKARASQ